LYFTVPSPEITIPPQNVSAAIYTNITFSCTGRGFGTVKVVWTKPPSKVTSTAVYTSERNDDHIVSTLSLVNLVAIYSGTYCCAIENHVGSSIAKCAKLSITSELLVKYYVRICIIATEIIIIYTINSST